MNQSTTWRALVWKDFHQVREALLACLTALAGIQLLYLALQLLTAGTDMAVFQETYVIALSAPTIVAIACSGLLIGQERQSRTWNWSSSLPIDWRAALGSKVIVWLSASVAMTLVLLTFHAALVQVAVQYGKVPTPSTFFSTEESTYFSATIMVVALEAFVALSIACLLWNDTLLALIGAAIVLSIIHLFLTYPMLNLVLDLGSGEPFRPAAHLGTTLAIVLTAVGGATIGLCYAFRWRWTSGQLASITVVPDRGLSAVSNVGRQQSWQTFAERSWRPEEFGMMFAHGLRSGMGVRLAIVLFSIGLPLVGLIREGNIILFTVGACLLIGITAFAGDRTLNRDRFFADRGASWGKLLAAHALLAFLTSLIVVTANMAFSDQLPPGPQAGGLVIVALSLVAFLIGLFSSLSTTSAVIAVTLAALTFLLCSMSYIGADFAWSLWTGEHGTMLFGVPLSLTILAAGIAMQMRRSLIFDSPKTMPLFSVVIVVGVLVPLLLCLSLGYIRVPSVAWQGIPEEQLNVELDAKLPALHVDTPTLANNYSLTISPREAHNERMARNELYITDALDHVKDAGGVKDWLEKWRSSIDQLQTEVDQPDLFTPATSTSLEAHSRLIESLALVAAIATRERNAETAVAAWQLNRALLNLGLAQPQLVTRSLDARLKTYDLWYLLSDQDIAFLKAHADDQPLLPTQISDDQWVHALKRRWTFRKLLFREDAELAVHSKETLITGRVYPSLDGFPDEFRIAADWIPPLRWYAERAMAYSLDNELSAFANSPDALHDQASVVASPFAAHDIMFFELQVLRRLEMHVMQRVRRVASD